MTPESHNIPAEMMNPPAAPAAPAEEAKLPPPPEFNYSQTKRIAKHVLGATARVWNREGLVQIGTEFGSEKRILVAETTFTRAVEALIKTINDARASAHTKQSTEAGLIQGK